MEKTLFEFLFPFSVFIDDNKMNEIDLIILEDGILHRVECKTGITFNMSAVSSFKCVENTKYVLGTSIILCNTDAVCPLEKDIYAFPLAGI